MLVCKRPRKEMFSYHICQVSALTRVGISGTTAKSCKPKFVPLSHLGPFAVVALSRKSQIKVGTLAYFDFLYQKELTI